MNEKLTYEVIRAAIQVGVNEFVVCPGSRNRSFVQALKNQTDLKVYYGFEERSSAFFAIGRSRATNLPVAIVTTSGTAAGELLPAAMEAHYSGVPILLITADRPRNFRGTGAPQSAEQKKLFGPYVSFGQDIAEEESCSLSEWSQLGPAHLNVCLNEPQKEPPFIPMHLPYMPYPRKPRSYDHNLTEKLDEFLKNTKCPLVIVSTLKQEAQSAVVEFLEALQIPVIVEGISGIREVQSLEPWRIMQTEKILERAEQCGYQIDGVLRIGGVPTKRLWRDLEYLETKVHVCSVSEGPFSGLSWNQNVICAPIDIFLSEYKIPQGLNFQSAEQWLELDRLYLSNLLELFQEEPQAEASLVHALSKMIPQSAKVYLGNSLPIREWDLAATYENRGFEIHANRGVNGIDGQTSTFLGLCNPRFSNWAILGDLTALYDMAAPWMLAQMENSQIQIVVINNGGGKIFQRMYDDVEMLNGHGLRFESFAHFWGLPFVRWTEIPEQLNSVTPGLIEVIPDEAATKRFWEKHASLLNSLTLLSHAK